jgi:nucleotide-binding universal stress UspA family protein
VLASLWVGLALVAALLAIWFKISTALTEIVVGKVAQLVVGAIPPEPATSVELDAMLDDAREHFEESFKKIAKHAQELEVEFETAIAVGHPIQQIVHRAEADHTDLIVLGRRGMSRFEKMLVGSTSEKVLRYAHCPVMVVRQNKKTKKG